MVQVFQVNIKSIGTNGDSANVIETVVSNYKYVRSSLCFVVLCKLKHLSNLCHSSSFYLDGTWRCGCGGALISPRHVLLCRHCFKDKKAEVMEVGFGKTVQTDNEGVVKGQVQGFVFHPNLDIAINYHFG